MSMAICKGPEYDVTNCDVKRPVLEAAAASSACKLPQFYKMPEICCSALYGHLRAHCAWFVMGQEGGGMCWLVVGRVIG